FKEIAEKMYTRTPIVDTLKTLKTTDDKAIQNFEKYHELAQNNKVELPDVVGLSAMDAVPLLENMGWNVQLNGNGIIAAQSVIARKGSKKNRIVKLTAK